mgnify:CR=1 FL=1
MNQLVAVFCLPHRAGGKKKPNIAADTIMFWFRNDILHDGYSIIWLFESFKQVIVGNMCFFVKAVHNASRDRACAALKCTEIAG